MSAVQSWEHGWRDNAAANCEAFQLVNKTKQTRTHSQKANLRHSYAQLLSLAKLLFFKLAAVHRLQLRKNSYLKKIVWKPRYGSINSARLQIKSEYKLAIRKAAVDFEKSHKDEIT